MLPQVSRTALLLIGKEVNTKSFTAYTLNRLKNENPHYAHLANFFAKKAKAEIGEAGFQLALDHFAVFYRVLELSARYPDPPAADPIERASDRDRDETMAEALALIERLRGGGTDGKWPFRAPTKK